jgi:hypothetical protein
MLAAMGATQRLNKMILTIAIFFSIQHMRSFDSAQQAAMHASHKNS